MERTAEEEREAKKWRAVEKLAAVVRELAEERHDALKHDGPFHKCISPVCAFAREAYLAL